MTSPQAESPQKTPDPAVDMDPYFDWALRAGRQNYFLPGRQEVWIPVLLKLTGISIAEFAKGDGLFNSASPRLNEEVAQFQKFIKVPDAYTDPPDALEKDDAFCMAMVAHEYFLDQIEKNSLLASKVVEVELGLPLDAIRLAPLS